MHWQLGRWLKEQILSAGLMKNLAGPVGPAGSPRARNGTFKQPRTPSTSTEMRSTSIRDWFQKLWAQLQQMILVDMLLGNLFQ